jgi:hypothetical protein
MSYQATIITIFLSSPGDVPNDRNLIIRTINGWNQRNGKVRRAFFQPLTWEQTVAPDRRGSGQEVINSQIDVNYDIYLGLMWSRFGSVTTKADSGTEDEFDQAVARHDTGEGPTISFLFKNSPIPQDILEGLQYDKVQKFKTKVASSGCLYREFNDDASLVDAVNLILDRFANQLSDIGDLRPKARPGPNSTARSASDQPYDPSADVQSDELGLWDYNDILETEGERFSQLMGEWGSRIAGVGEKAVEATDELNSISRFGQIEPKAAKKIIGRVTAYTDSTVHWGEENQNLIDDSMEKFAEAFSGLIIVSKDFSTAKEDIEAGIKAGEHLVETVRETNSSLEELSKAVLSLPRISKEMIRANKRLADLLDRMVAKNMTFAANINISVAELRKQLEIR